MKKKLMKTNLRAFQSMIGRCFCGGWSVAGCLAGRRKPTKATIPLQPLVPPFFLKLGKQKENGVKMAAAGSDRWFARQVPCESNETKKKRKNH
jgi:hypothetical protein